MKGERSERGISLIIVIFIVMLLGMMAWSLAVMQATDFDANTRVHNSEKAFYLAETGLNYCYDQLINDPTWHTGTSFDNNCSATDWVTHNLTGGQYRFCCRAPTTAEQGMGNIAIQAEGYVPSYANYSSMRQLKVVLALGAFTNTCQARGLLDWSSWNSGSYIKGDIMAGQYEGNGNATHNELNLDYLSGTNNELPPGNNGDVRLVGSEPFPAVDMAYYESAAAGFSQLWIPPLTAKITALQQIVAGSKTEIQVDNLTMFSSGNWIGQAVRDISLGHCAAGRVALITDQIDSKTVRVDGIQDWQVGERITIAVRPSAITWNRSTRTYSLTLPVNVFTTPYSQWNGDCLRRLVYRQDPSGAFVYPQWEFQNWGVLTVTSATQCTVAIDSSVTLPAQYNPPADPVYYWHVAGWFPWVTVGQRFNDDVSTRQNVLYDCGDTLIDVRTSGLSFIKTGLVSEGDVAIKGTQSVYFDRQPLLYPNVATKYGNIYSDLPAGNNDNQRLGNRNFDDILFTQYGDVNVNYLDAKAVYGGNITFDGVIHLNYDRNLKKLGGYSWGFANMHWQEQ